DEYDDYLKSQGRFLLMEAEEELEQANAEMEERKVPQAKVPVKPKDGKKEAGASIVGETLANAAGALTKSLTKSDVA
ncbi:unnamed protein product, partial [Amoebophrya sp. A120]